MYGGASILNQIKAMRRGVDVIVGTPGRVLDHIGAGYLDLTDVRMAVLDESDEMLDMGFVDDIKEFSRQRLQSVRPCSFSATMPERYSILRSATCALRKRFASAPKRWWCRRSSRFSIGPPL